MIRLLLATLMILPLQLRAEMSTPLEYSRNFKQQLDELRDLPAEDFLQKVDGYRESLETFVEHKKRVCNGEFSTIVLGMSDQENKSRKKNKLTREERILCFREIKGFEVTLVNNLYAARRRYLDYLHEKRIKELESARDTTIKSLQSSFSKGQGRR